MNLSVFVSIGDEFIYDRPESPMIPLDQIMLLYEFLIADSCWNSVELISHCIF